MKRNIILIGPMGVGKSTIGRHLAKQLHMDFVDSDKEIERRTGASVSLIFEIEGEQGFRQREQQMIEELAQRGNMVLATGGGAILNKQNRINLRKRGTVVYLHASVNTQLERTRSNKNRPLLDTDDPRAKLESLMRAREPLYRQEADVVINTERRSAARVAQDIIRQLDSKS